MRRPRSLVLFLGVVLATRAASLSAQDLQTDLLWLEGVLLVAPGSTVAQIGAGDGQAAIAVARDVGPDGTVYAWEMPGEPMDRLNAAVEASGVTNVIVIEGAPNRASLPDECCDAVFMRSTYRAVDEPRIMNATMRRALRPGGRLAVIDLAPLASESAPPGGRSSGDFEGVTASTVVSELIRAGFGLLAAEQRVDRVVRVVVEKPSTK